MVDFWGTGYKCSSRCTGSEVVVVWTGSRTSREAVGLKQSERGGEWQEGGEVRSGRIL